MVNVRPTWSRRLALAGLAIACTAVAAPDWRLETEMLPPRVMVQTEAIYRLRFYQGVAIRDLDIEPPSLPLAKVRPSGTQRIFETQREGRRYRVHERHYAIFPYASGDLKITGARVNGELPSASPGEKKRYLRLQGDTLTLAVQPLPAGHFLAAHALTLSEQWKIPDPASYHPARWLRRQIRIEARGIDATQIPELKLDIPGYAIHPDSARLENRSESGMAVAARIQTYNLVPQRDALPDIPALSLRWWRIGDQTSQLATLPARPFDTAPMASAPESSAPETAPPPPVNLALAGLLGGLVVLAGIRRSAIRLEWRLQRAMAGENPTIVRDAILALAARCLPAAPPSSLGAVAAILDDPEARGAAQRLERIIYGPPASPPSRHVIAGMARQIKRGLRRKRSTR